jgi:hypothetical protein
MKKEEKRQGAISGERQKQAYSERDVQLGEFELSLSDLGIRKRRLDDPKPNPFLTRGTVESPENCFQSTAKIR